MNFSRANKKKNRSKMIKQRIRKQNKTNQSHSQLPTDALNYIKNGLITCLDTIGPHLSG